MLGVEGEASPKGRGASHGGTAGACQHVGVWGGGGRGWGGLTAILFRSLLCLWLLSCWFIACAAQTSQEPKQFCLAISSWASQPKVSIHVQLQLVLSCKALSTTFASKRSFSSVCSNVSIEMRNPCKLGFAESTCIRSYVIVHLKEESI